MSIDRTHVLHYSIVFGIIVLGVAIVGLSSLGKPTQLIGIIGVCLLYFLYGILHHHFEHDLTVKIVVEYVLVAALVVALFLFVYGGI